MGNPLEVELKLAISPEDVETLLAADWVRAAAPTSIPLAATYFDTADRALAKAGFVLRIRREGERVVQTVKATGEGGAGLFARPEWDCPLEPDETAPRLDATAGPLGEMVDAHALATLAPTFTTDVRREEARIERDAGVAMLAIDRGSVSAGERREAFCEVELELVSGEPDMLFGLARTIGSLVPARLGVLSKAERGHRLAADAPARAVKAERIALAPDMIAGAALDAIAHACLRQFRLNEDLLAAADDPDILHQARVGLRRLRSALSLFKPLLDGDPAAAHHRGELRWLQQTLGDARDLDVLIARIGLGEDAARLALARSEAYETVERTLASGRARGILLDVAEWLAVGAWRNSAAAARPIAATAAEILDRHRKRIARRGKDLAKLSDEDRHQVRIEAKKLRYATDFFAALYVDGKPARRHRKFTAAVAEVQSVLGTLNDLATAPLLAARLALVPPEPVEKGRHKALIAEAADALDELLDAKRFWR